MPEKKRSSLKSVIRKAMDVVISGYNKAVENYGGNVSDDSVDEYEDDDNDDDDDDDEDDDEDDTEEDDDDDDDVDVDVDVADDDELKNVTSNKVNGHLVSMYLRNNKHNNGIGQELIDISSDEDTNNDCKTKNKSFLHDISVDQTTCADNEVTPKKTLTKKSNKEESNKSRHSLKRKLSLSYTSNKRKKDVPITKSTVTFKDIGGCEQVLKEVSQLLLHIRHPEVYKTLGVSPPRGFLLHGPPGSGKTLLAYAIAGELGVSLLKVAGTEMIGSQSGESEERIRNLFNQAKEMSPSVLFIDEVDAITPKRETAQREMERRIVAQLLSSLDELNSDDNGDQVLVIGATNRPDALDPALRRAGRFDKEVCLGIPDSGARYSILKTLCKELKVAQDVSLNHIVLMTPGFVGADLKALVTDAAMAAVNRLFSQIKKEKDKKEIFHSNESNSITDNGNIIHNNSTELNTEDVSLVTTTEENLEIEVIDINEQVNVKNKHDSLNGNFFVKDQQPLTPEQLKNLFITTEDFKVALKSVQPSAKREGFATVPDVTWNDIGSLQDIRQELQMAIMAPVRYPQQFEVLGLSKPTGILLCGPPGCGKTLLAKAVANEAGINFISVKGPELLNMYVGESERAVRQCFQRARNSQPCVIFFDEIDALCPKRSNLNENGASRVVNQLLTEMDGVEGRTGVFLMAATNRPDIVDPAVMRPGRLDKVLYIGLPSPTDRFAILRALTKNGTKPVLSEDVNLEDIASNSRCKGYTGADLAALIREAGVQVLKEYMADTKKPSLAVSMKHFMLAFDKIRPSVTPQDQLRYEQLRARYSATHPTNK
uniref:AAA+ ATPase domain-containing protein n=2 Tax=Clastoptera arizonana TaxID=38151 RepID=A0A1B6E946_9HEMI